MALLRLKKDWTLRFSVGAARRFKAEYGKALWKVRLLEPGELMPELTDPDCLVHLLNVGLSAQDKNMSLQKAERLLDEFLEAGGDIATVYMSIAEAFNESGLFGRAAAEPEPEDEADPNE